MSIRLLVWGLTAARVLALALWVLSLLIVLGAPWLGEPLQSSWTISPVTGHPPAAAALGEAHVTLQQGQLILLGGSDGWLIALKALDVLVLGAIALAVLTLLRRFALEVRAGTPFGDHAARRLRTIGCLLMGWPAWQVLHAGLAQTWLLSHAGRVAPDLVLLHSFAPGPGSADSVRLLVDADVSAAVAGLVLLVVARAFSVGISLRRDLQEIV
ncbi:MAG TPA: hypothetical protein VIM90_01600 [Arenimonas sp.]